MRPIGSPNELYAHAIVLEREAELMSHKGLSLAEHISTLVYR